LGGNKNRREKQREEERMLIKNWGLILAAKPK